MQKFPSINKRNQNQIHHSIKLKVLKLETKNLFGGIQKSLIFSLNCFLTDQFQNHFSGRFCEKIHEKNHEK